MSVVLTAPIPGVKMPSFPFGGTILTGLRIRCSPWREVKMTQNDVTLLDDLQAAFYCEYCRTLFYNIFI